ncbi:MAG: CdaR family protein [Lactobacillus sp.]|nr:CdaR family protein [Lactobacillus sp.]
MKKKIFRESWFLKISSLLISLLIVIYVNTTQQAYMKTNTTTKTTETATNTTTVTADLQISANTDKYYITGYPEQVKLTIEGPSALVTSTVNTSAYRVYLDLSDLGVGKHTVKIQVTGLSKQLTYYVKPAYVTVNIQQRKSRTLPVTTQYDSEALPKGYDIGKISLDHSVVEVTGAQSEINQIKQILAKVDIPDGITHTLNQQVVLQAIDRKGRQLNVSILPASVKVQVPISISKKKLPVEIKTYNDASNKSYITSTDTKYVTLYGKKAVLKKLSKATAYVDLEHITSTKTVQASIKLPSGVAYSNPDNVKVHVKVSDSGSTERR